jgi:hypothetical protein
VTFQRNRVAAWRRDPAGDILSFRVKLDRKLTVTESVPGFRGGEYVVGVFVDTRPTNPGPEFLAVATNEHRKVTLMHVAGFGRQHNSRHGRRTRLTCFASGSACEWSRPATDAARTMRTRRHL